MKLRERFASDKPSLSFEVFPPKTTDKYESVKFAAEEIAKLNPSYMSVTYGAGGGTSAYTVSIAADLQLSALKEAGIENILALRGDIPDGMTLDPDRDYHYASELIADIKSYGYDFCIGGACYPEKHVESETVKEDIINLKKKVDAGCEFLTTQMFFDNNILYNFLYKIREAGITVPVIPGIMPVTNAKQIVRSCQLSGTYLPARFKQIVDRFGDDPNAMKQAGIAYATDQIIDLFANGVNHVHVYSMNKPDVAAKIIENLSDIIA